MRLIAACVQWGYGLWVSHIVCHAPVIRPGVACAVGAGLGGTHLHGFIEGVREVFLAHAPLDFRSLLCTPFLGGATLVVLLALLARAGALAHAVLAAIGFDDGEAAEVAREQIEALEVDVAHHLAVHDGAHAAHGVRAAAGRHDLDGARACLVALDRLRVTRPPHEDERHLARVFARYELAVGLAPLLLGPGVDEGDRDLAPLHHGDDDGACDSIYVVLVPRAGRLELELLDLCGCAQGLLPLVGHPMGGRKCWLAWLCLCWAGGLVRFRFV